MIQSNKIQRLLEIIKWTNQNKETILRLLDNTKILIEKWLAKWVVVLVVLDMKTKLKNTHHLLLMLRN
jgi:hypothetical protein